METLLPVGDVELCVDTVGSPTDIPLLLIGTTVATWDDELVERLTGRFVLTPPRPASTRPVFSIAAVRTRRRRATAC